MAAWNSPAGRDFISRWWHGAAIAAGVIGLVLLFPSVRRKVKGATSSSRDALLIFVVTPLLLSVVGTIVFMPNHYQVPMLRGVFLLIVCLLPDSVWYLFIVTRKTSVLNDFVGHLNRLGLLERGHTAEDDPEREAVSGAASTPTSRSSRPSTAGCLPG